MAIPGLSRFLWALRQQESGGNYQAFNSGSRAAGAYQFLWSTWRYAENLANLQSSPYYNYPIIETPSWFQDDAAGALVTRYYWEFAQSYYNVAEAWYGGPGAVGHPDWGGGPGYPNVGQYANQVMARYGSGPGSSGGGGFSVSPHLTSYDRALLAMDADTIYQLSVATHNSTRIINMSGTIKVKW
jgi:hypothetical protein